MNVNNKLKLAIFKSGMKKQEIADKAGIPRTTLYNAEKGRKTYPHNQQAIAKVLGKKVEELF